MPKDFNLNERNFLPRSGQKPLPVYTEHYNKAMDTLEDLQDAVTGSGGLDDQITNLQAVATGTSMPKYDSVGAVPTTGAWGNILTVVESGDEVTHRSKISGTVFTVAGIKAGALTNANKAFGAKIYDFPAGGIRVHNVVLDLTLTGTLSTATPEVGIGTLVATGATSTLGGAGATTEDIIDGVASPAITSAGAALHRVAAAETAAAAFDGGTAAKDAYLNFAAAWGATGTFVVTGDVYLTWSFLGDYS